MGSTGCVSESGREQRGWDHGDAVAAAIRLGSGRDHGGVGQVRADALGEPPKMPSVVVGDGCGEFHL